MKISQAQKEYDAAMREQHERMLADCGFVESPQSSQEEEEPTQG